MLFLALFRTSIFWPKNHSFLSELSKNDLYKLVFSHKNKREKVWCLDKHHGLSPLDNVDVLHVLKIYFSGLKIILFSPEYQKTTFSNLISLKTQIRNNSIFGQNHGLSP